MGERVCGMGERVCGMGERVCGMGERVCGMGEEVIFEGGLCVMDEEGGCQRWVRRRFLRAGAPALQSFSFFFLLKIV